MRWPKHCLVKRYSGFPTTQNAHRRSRVWAKNLRLVVTPRVRASTQRTDGTSNTRAKTDEVWQQRLCVVDDEKVHVGEVSIVAQLQVHTFMIMRSTLYIYTDSYVFWLRSNWVCSYHCVVFPAVRCDFEYCCRIVLFEEIDFCSWPVKTKHSPIRHFQKWSF